MFSSILTTIITSLPPLSNNSFTLNFKSECPFRYKKAIIHNLISRAKLISSSKTIFYKEVENIKQAYAFRTETMKTPHPKNIDNYYKTGSHQ